MRRAALPSILTFWFAASGVGATPPCAGGARLFVVERSINASAVVYEATPAPGGGVDPVRPLCAYWRLDGRGGERTELTALERALAYGFDVEPASRDGELQFTIRALPDRAIRVRMGAAGPEALTVISGRTAVLRRVFVEVRSRLSRPDAIDLEGVCAASGEPVRERLLLRRIGAGSIDPR